MESGKVVRLLERASYSVSSIRKRPQSRSPKAPFTTSSLIQAASGRHQFKTKRTMSLAQQLFYGVELPDEGQVSLITYMRTDSTNIAAQAKEDARVYIASHYGADSNNLPDAPRTYPTKQKGAQEGHEAIRPTSITREPGMLEKVLTRDQHRIYSLIWQRFVACQMSNAEYDVTTLEVRATPAGDSDTLLLRATESVLRVPGYRRVYQEEREADAFIDDQSAPGLPPLITGDVLQSMKVKAQQHFTDPPPRFNEATLIRALEEHGIGRPSTYGSIMSKIRDRGYV